MIIDDKFIRNMVNYFKRHSRTPIGGSYWVLSPGFTEYLFGLFSLN